MKRPRGGIFFDLDGTLADTAPDLGGALNRLLLENDREPLKSSVIRPHVSKGAAALVELGFGITPIDPEYIKLRQRFLELYSAHICDRTRLFPGIHELLLKMRIKGLLWGIVTNKPAAYTIPLLERLDLPDTPAAVVCGDTLASKKPSPEPLLHACVKSGAIAAQSVYVGDDERDMIAAQAAGMQSIAVTYGYHLPEEKPERWNANEIAHNVGDVSRWLHQAFNF